MDPLQRKQPPRSSHQPEASSTNPSMSEAPSGGRLGRKEKVQTWSDAGAGMTLKQTLDPFKKGIKTIHDIFSKSWRRRGSNASSRSLSNESMDSHYGADFHLTVAVLQYADADGGNTDDTDTVPRRAYFDSGSDISLVRLCIIEELGIPYYKHPSKLQPLGCGTCLMDLGWVQVHWRCEGLGNSPITVYTTKFHVCPDDWNIPSDFLLGRNWKPGKKHFSEKAGLVPVVRHIGRWFESTTLPDQLAATVIKSEHNT